MEKNVHGVPGKRTNRENYKVSNEQGIRTAKVQRLRWLEHVIRIKAEQKSAKDKRKYYNSKKDRMYNTKTRRNKVLRDIQAGYRKQQTRKNGEDQ